MTGVDARAPKDDAPDRGLVLLELLMVTAIVGALAAVLAVVIASAYSGVLRVRRDAETSTRTETVYTHFRSMTEGAALPGICLDRTDPTAAASVVNCSVLDESDSPIYLATGSELCTWTSDAIDSAGATLLTARGVECLELTAYNRLESTKRVAQTAEYVDPTVFDTASSPFTLLRSALSGDRTAVPADTGSAFRYFDGLGVELVPGTGSPAALDAVQRARVRSVRLAVTVMDPNGDPGSPVVLVGPIGPTRFRNQWLWGS